MTYIRPAHARGNANFGWLQSRHSFSFGNYFDPKHMGYSTLRVINDDVVAGGAGFGSHPHQNMEIISYVTQGEMVHQDSLGNRHVIPAGDIQVMSAGTGITHSEYNGSDKDELRFLQIWIMPRYQNVAPAYHQTSVPAIAPDVASIVPLVAGDAALAKTADARHSHAPLHAPLPVNADATIFRVHVPARDVVELGQSGRASYVHVLQGTGEVGEHGVEAGGGLGLRDKFKLSAPADNAHGVTALVFDLPLE